MKSNKVQVKVITASLALISTLLPKAIHAQESIFSPADWTRMNDITSPNFIIPRRFIQTLIGGGQSNNSLGVLNLAIVFAGLLLLLMILQGGFTMLTNPTNPEAQAQGKARITWGIVGFLVVFGTYWIAQILEVLFNVNIV